MDLALSEGKPVFEDLDSLLNWVSGKGPCATVSSIALNARDVESKNDPVPEIKIAVLIGDYTFPQVNYRKHCKSVLAAEEASVELWNAGVCAFSPQRALCDFEISPKGYDVFCEYILERTADCAVVLPGWQKSSLAKKQVVFAQSQNIPVLGGVEAAVSWANNDDGYYVVHLKEEKRCSEFRSIFYSYDAA